ncbi:UNVERIFIED_CONTAM: hypothetical protein H355_016940 [Colinus virginianus]|nr:hypothetical protein H355_016940 [Colinus virginianus]
MLGSWLAVLPAYVLTLPARRASTLAQQEFCSSFQGSFSPDIARVEISEGACVRFVRSSTAMTLTLDHTAKHLLESDVRLFRKYFWNRPLLHEYGEGGSDDEENSDIVQTSINSNQVQPVEDPKMPCSMTSSAEGPVSLLSDDLSQEDVKPLYGAVVPSKEIGDHVLLDIAQRHSTLDVLKRLKTPPTFFSAARLSTMQNGSDEVYANCMLVDQAGDLKMSYIHGDSISSEMCLNPTSSAPIAKSSSSPSLEENDQYRCDPNEGNWMLVKNEGNTGLRPTASPSDLYEADFYLPFKTREYFKEQGQLHAVMKKKRYGTDLMIWPE